MKKKILSVIMIAVLALSVCAFAACDDIEQGSKIQRMVITLEFYDASGKVADTKDVQVKLYTNFAPMACERFVKLAEDGYFNGTCVSNVQSNWFEFGEYSYDENGLLTKKEFDTTKYGTLKGEVEKNGWIGNKLYTKSGALLFKHDTETTTNMSKYDTAKGTVIIALGSISKYVETDYCVFGMVCSDDQGDNPYSSLDDSSLKNRSGKTSLNVAYTVADLVSNDGVRTFYYTKEDTFYTRVIDDDGTRYYQGIEINETTPELDGDDLEKIQDLIAESDPELYTVPYTKVVIKSVTKKA